MSSYPSRHGRPLHPDELCLPASGLNLNNPHNFNNHHLYFEKRRYTGDFILNALRDLESSQVMLPKDQHNQGRQSLHSLYTPPRLPTHRQAMDALADGFEQGVGFKVWDMGAVAYRYYDFTDTIWNCLTKKYKEEL